MQYVINHGIFNQFLEKQNDLKSIRM